jgi:hypothetical protein
MDIKVLMASGDEDEWVDAVTTLVDHGSLVIVGELPEDAEEGEYRTIVVKEKDSERTFRVHAMYMPGMVIKVEYP